MQGKLTSMLTLQVVSFYKGVKKVIRDDHLFIYMMIILALFSSDREKLNDPEQVQQSQDVYALVLEVKQV